jgi:hypothetical protein
MEITGEVLQVVAGEIEKLLIEQRDGINYAYVKLNECKVSLTIDFLPLIDQISVDYQLSYSLEPKPEPRTKQTVKRHSTIGDVGISQYPLVQDTAPII